MQTPPAEFTYTKFYIALFIDFAQRRYNNKNFIDILLVTLKKAVQYYTKQESVY